MPCSVTLETPLHHDFFIEIPPVLSLTGCRLQIDCASWHDQSLRVVRLRFVSDPVVVGDLRGRVVALYRVHSEELGLVFWLDRRACRCILSVHGAQTVKHVGRLLGFPTIEPSLRSGAKSSLREVADLR